MSCRKPPSRSQYCGGKLGGAKKKRRKKRTKKKSCRPGKVTRNPFFNYLRWFRKKHCGWPAVKIAVEGAKCWCKMSNEQRAKFYKEACNAPPFKRRHKSRGRSGSRGRRSRSRGRRGKRSRSRSRSRRKGRSSCGGGRSRRRKSRKRRPKKAKKRCDSACFQKRRVKSVC